MNWDRDDIDIEIDQQNRAHEFDQWQRACPFAHDWFPIIGRLCTISILLPVGMVRTMFCEFLL